MQYSKRNLLYYAIYSTSCRFANIEQYVDSVAQYTQLDSFCRVERFSDYLGNLAKDINIDSPITDNAQAQRRLIALDLKTLASQKLDYPEASLNPVTWIEKSAAVIRSRLESISLSVPLANFYLVDNFPLPFDKVDWAAFAPDSEDEQNYGILQGIYFKKSKLRPLYSEALYAHEFIHTVTGQVDPEIYVSGLEEGIAEILGTCYGGLSIFNITTLKNILIYGRHGVDRPAIWSLYRDHIRQAYLLYREFGLAGLVNLVQQGREAIHRVAEQILTGGYHNLELPKGNFDHQISAVLDFICNAFIPSHTYSPLQCLLIPYIRTGREISEVCALAGVEVTTGTQALRTISANSALFLIAGQRIGYSNVERLLTTEEKSGFKLLRYTLDASL